MNEHVEILLHELDCEFKYSTKFKAVFAGFHQISHRDDVNEMQCY